MRWGVGEIKRGLSSLLIEGVPEESLLEKGEEEVEKKEEKARVVEERRGGEGGVGG